MTAMKAHVVADNHLRVLAIPFSGPFGGKDFDGEFFSPRTDIKADWFSERPVLWHHGQDETLGDAVIGKATDLTLEDEGWWVDVWLKRGERYADLVLKLASKAALYGSSGTIGYLKRADSKTGEILVWPYVEQTLTLTPSNNFSVTRPAKSVLDAYHHAHLDAGPALEAAVAFEQALSADLSPTSNRGAAAAKAGYGVLERTLESVLRELRS